MARRKHIMQDSKHSIDHQPKAASHTVQIADASLVFAQIPIDDETPTGRQIAISAGMRNPDEVIVLHMKSDGQLDEINPDEFVRLETSSRKFIVVHSDRTYNLLIDGSRVSWPVRVISGATLRQLGGVPDNQTLYQEMANVPDIVVESEDLVDLDGAGVERFVSRAAVWQLNVQGVMITSQTPTIVVRDALLLAKFDVSQGWHIFLKVTGKPKQAVELTTVVDLREPGIEKLRLTPKEVNNGESSQTGRRDFSLLEIDETHLNAFAALWETVVENGRRWLIIHAYQIPTGYTAVETKLALEIPATYPGSQIDMFYCYPPLALPSGREIPSTQVRAIIDNVEFHGWSRHRGSTSEWMVGVDNVVTHLALVESALQKEVE